MLIDDKSRQSLFGMFKLIILKIPCEKSFAQVRSIAQHQIVPQRLDMCLGAWDLVLQTLFLK